MCTCPTGLGMRCQVPAVPPGLAGSTEHAVPESETMGWRVRLGNACVRGRVVRGRVVRARQRRDRGGTEGRWHHVDCWSLRAGLSGLPRRMWVGGGEAGEGNAGSAPQSVEVTVQKEPAARSAHSQDLASTLPFTDVRLLENGSCCLLLPACFQRHPRFPFLTLSPSLCVCTCAGARTHTHPL